MDNTVKRLGYRTRSLKASECGDKQWFIVDCKGKCVGRMASQIVSILRGKQKPSYTPFMDCGDNVIAINTSGLLFSGKKMTEKEYMRHTGYPGGQRKTTPHKLIQLGFSSRIFEKAVKGMLPKSILGRKMFKNLYSFEGEKHGMESKHPIKIDLKD